MNCKGRAMKRRKVQAVFAEEPLLRLNREQTRRVLELIERPPRPNVALRAAKAAHWTLVRSPH